MGGGNGGSFWLESDKGGMVAAVHGSKITGGRVERIRKGMERLGTDAK